MALGFVRVAAGRRAVVLVFAFLMLAAGSATLRGTRAVAAPSVRGAYGGPSSEIKAAGFNTVIASPGRSTLDSLNVAGLKGVVWLGQYSNSSCSFATSDASLTSTIQSLAGHPAVAAWQISDEPKATSCPSAPQQHRDRTALIHRYDSRPTYTVISTWDGQDVYPYQKFAGTTDIMGIDVYTCRYNATACSFSMIDTAIAEADKDGVPHYWAVPQGFGDSYYRMPTQAEMKEQFVRWNRSRMEGYLLYHWSQQGSFMVDWCAKHAYCVDEAKAFNGGSTPAPSPSPTSPAPSPSPTPTLTPSPTPAADATPPTIPAALNLRWVKRAASVSWSAATDNVGVTGYRVYRDGALVGTTTGTTYTDRPNAKLAHRYEVRAVDAAGNLSTPAVGLLDALR